MSSLRERLCYFEWKDDDGRELRCVRKKGHESPHLGLQVVEFRERSAPEPEVRK